MSVIIEKLAAQLSEYADQFTQAGYPAMGDVLRGDALGYQAKARLFEAAGGPKDLGAEHDVTPLTEQQLPLGRFLKARRSQLLVPGRDKPGISQEVMAQRAGISVAWYQKIEQERSNPSLDKLLRLARACELNRDQAVGFIESYASAETQLLAIRQGEDPLLEMLFPKKPSPHSS